jgi:FtsH-binding integral membrane protein
MDQEQVATPKENVKTMNNVFFYTIMSCLVMSILLFGGSLFIYHFVMGAGADASMKPMWLVLLLTIAGFIGLLVYHKKNKP